jgi:hypothetical protein
MSRDAVRQALPARWIRQPERGHAEQEHRGDCLVRPRALPIPGPGLDEVTSVSFGSARTGQLVRDYRHWAVRMVQDSMGHRSGPQVARVLRVSPAEDNKVSTSRRAYQDTAGGPIHDILDNLDVRVFLPPGRQLGGHPRGCLRSDLEGATARPADSGRQMRRNEDLPRMDQLQPRLTQARFLECEAKRGDPFKVATPTTTCRCTAIVSSLTTTTGHAAAKATCRLTEPSTRAANPPAPREPTTSNEASAAAPARACAGRPDSRLVLTDRPGSISAARSAAAASA